jgi:hypothetical protein
MSRQERFNMKSESSAMSLINSMQQLSTFQKEKFDGAKWKFNEFQDEVMIAVQNKLGSKGRMFLFTVWPNNVPVGEEYNTVAVPNMLDGLTQVQAIDAQGNPQVDAQGQPVMTAVTPAMRKDRRDEIKMIKDHNSEIFDMERKCVEIISERCNAAINQTLVNFNGDPLRCWDYLRRTFGPESRGPQDKGSAFIEFAEIRMQPNERFTNFLVDFQRKQAYTLTSDDSANGLLQSDGNSKFKLQVLPDRLMPAVAKCKESKYDYAQTIEFITQYDDIQHQNGNLEGDKKRKNVYAIKRLEQDSEIEKKKNEKGLYCYNCKNYGHLSRECALDACTYCKKFNINHKANDCPKRIADKKNKPSQQWPKGRGQGKEYSPNKKVDKKSQPKKFKSKFPKNKKDFKKKNVKRVSTQSDDDDDDDDDDEDDYEDIDEDDDEDSDDEQGFGSKNAYRVFDAGKRIRAVKDVSRSASVNLVAKRPAIIDTGADEHCIKRIDTFTNITEKYNSRNMVPDVELHQANGDVLEIEAKGTVYPSVVEDAYHTPSIDGDLVSGPKLQDKDCWIILPPSSVSKSIGAIVTDKDGKVIMLGDKSMTTDLNQINTHDARVTLPDISDVVEQPMQKTTRSVNKVYGYPNAKIENIVEIMQKTFFSSKDDLLWKASGVIDNFPVTQEQIKKYWKEDACYLRGHMQSRKIDRKQYDSKDPEDVVTRKPSQKDWRNIDSEKLETRNLIIGKEVGTDIFGPVLGSSVVTFTDKASGYRVSYPFQKDGKKEMPQIIENVSNLYRKFGHHSKEFHVPIDVLKSDSESVYKSTFVKEVLDKHGITPVFSPPEQKQYNGLAESTHKNGGMKVSSMYSCASHVPEQKWISAWTLADIISNMKRSNIPGSNKTRFEEFRHEKPDMNKIILLPFGQPIEYFIPKSVREGKFGAHSAIGTYEGPDMDIPGGIWVYGYKNKRSVSRTTYRMLPHIPSSFVKIPLRYFVENDFINTNATNSLLTSVHVGNAIKDSEGDISAIGKEDEVQISEVFEKENVVSDLPMLPSLTSSAQDVPTVPTVAVDSNVGVTAPAEPTPQSVSIPLPAPPPPPRSKPALDQEGGLKTNEQYRVIRSPGGKSLQVFRGNTRIKVIHRKEKLSSSSRIARKVAAKRRSYDNPTLTQAMSRPDWPQWKDAIDTELKQMEEEGVFRIEKKKKKKKYPHSANIIGSMWVLQIKRDKHTGRIDKYKARLVALGNQQKNSSYTDISSSTVRTATVKLLISIQAKTNALSMVLDVKGAFLKSDVDKSKGEHLYLRLPDGDIVELHKYIYGLKQAGYEWQQNLTYFLIQSGYENCFDDPMLFSLHDGDHFIHMSIHVDDFYVISNSDIMMRELKDLLDNQYGEVSIKDDSILTYLGMVISKDESNHDIIITQPAYVEKILQQVKLNDMRSVSTPIAIDRTGINVVRARSKVYVMSRRKSKFKSKKSQKKGFSVDKTFYLQLVGSLNYLVQLTRPDLSYALSVVAQKCSMPTQLDLQRVKRIYKYIELTKSYGIRFTSDNDFRLICHVDASFNCYPDGRGHYGYCFSIGLNNGVFYAKSSKMKLTTLSSTETELVALCEATKEAISIRRIYNFLGYGKRPVVVYEDNKSCIEMARGNINRKVNKHIKPKFQYSMEQWKCRKIDIRYKKTQDMVADILTKALSSTQNINLSERILNW